MSQDFDRKHELTRILKHLLITNTASTSKNDQKHLVLDEVTGKR